MSRSILLSLLSYALLLTGIITVQGEYLALALPLVAYLLVGYLQAPEKIQLEAARQLSIERTSPNSNVDVMVTVTNRGSNLDEVLLTDLLPAGLTVRSGFSRHLLRLAVGESYTFAFTISGPRGGYVFEALEVQTSDHLAVSSSKVRVEAKGRLFVLPPVTRVRHIAIRPRRTRVYAGTIPARAGGAGTGSSVCANTSGMPSSIAGGRARVQIFMRTNTSGARGRCGHCARWSPADE
jgi:uncharacterized repeat protein (TIGR01451 family)